MVPSIRLHTTFEARRSGERQSQGACLKHLKLLSGSKHFSRSCLACFPYASLARLCHVTVASALQFQRLTRPGAGEEISFFEHISVHLITKLPTSAGSSKKQENSRKTSISALLTMPKPLTVWITVNCGKILKEMGIPDHLMCLLRQLDAGQETAVRTGHGTTTGSK